MEFFNITICPKQPVSLLFFYPKAASYGLLPLSAQTCLIVAELDLHKAFR
jgi:hypothetical protein